MCVAVVFVCWDVKPVFYAIWKPFQWVMGYSDPRSPTSDLLHGRPSPDMVTITRPHSQQHLSTEVCCMWVTLNGAHKVLGQACTSFAGSLSIVPYVQYLQAIHGRGHEQQAGVVTKDLVTKGADTKAVRSGSD